MLPFFASVTLETVTQSESDVPQSERVLTIDGAPTRAILDSLAKLSSFEIGGSAIPLFVGFTFADLPLGWKFTHIWKPTDPAAVEVVDGRIEACTQQFLKSFEEVPHGWRTIISFRFRDGVPLLVDALPTIQTWTHPPQLHLGSAETWRSVQEPPPLIS